MQGHSKRIRIIALAGVLAAAVLATGSAANAKTPTGRVVPPKPTAELVRIQSDLFGGDVYIWKVNGVQHGLPMW
jgi:hypothetical protein